MSEEHEVRVDRVSQLRNQPAHITKDEKQSENRAADQFFSSLLEENGLMKQYGQSGNIAFSLIDMGDVCHNFTELVNAYKKISTPK